MNSEQINSLGFGHFDTSLENKKLATCHGHRPLQNDNPTHTHTLVTGHTHTVIFHRGKQLQLATRTTPKPSVFAYLPALVVQSSSHVTCDVTRVTVLWGAVYAYCTVSYYCMSYCMLYV